MLLGGIVSWVIKARSEDLRAIEEKLRSERRQIYKELLEPYIRLFSDLKGKGAQESIKQINSFDYKKTSFELSLLGSDGVIKAYNDLMQYAIHTEFKSGQQTKELMRRWGVLLLEIRKSLGNKRTKLDELAMMRGTIKDIDEIQRN